MAFKSEPGIVAETSRIIKEIIKFTKWKIKQIVGIKSN